MWLDFGDISAWPFTLGAIFVFLAKKIIIKLENYVLDFDEIYLIMRLSWFY